MDGLFKIVIALCLAAGFGWHFASLMNTDILRQEFVQQQFDGEWRNPAAISKANDFSLLSGKALKSASHRRLLEDVRLVLNEGRFGIELGHFVVRGTSGDKQFACEYYDRVQLKFSADGTAVNGKIPYFLVEGHCKISRDINRMNPLWLPIASLKEMPPRNLRSYYFENEKVFISVYDLGTAWPVDWRLSGIRVFNQVKVGREIAVDSSINKSFFNHPITISW